MWINDIINPLWYTIGEPLAGALEYFFVTSLEIFALIFIIMFIVWFLESYIDREKLRKHIQAGKYGTPYIFATFLGIITPFCSCSSIPLFIWFLKSRIPLWVALSFLVTSPLVNEIVFVMLGSMFSWTIAFIYALLGIALWIIVGIIFDKIWMEKHIQIDIWEKKWCCKSPDNTQEIIVITFKSRVKQAVVSAYKTLKDMYKIVLIWIAIWAWIHGYVPKEVIVDNLSWLGLFSVPLATIFGVPMYASVASVIPIVAPLPELWVTLWTTVAFLMSVAALSLPEAMMLKRVMSWKFITLFFGIVSLWIIFIGYMIDFLF